MRLCHHLENDSNLEGSVCLGCSNIFCAECLAGHVCSYVRANGIDDDEGEGVAMDLEYEGLPGFVDVAADGLHDQQTGEDEEEPGFSPFADDGDPGPSHSTPFADDGDPGPSDSTSFIGDGDPGPSHFDGEAGSMIEVYDVSVARHETLNTIVVPTAVPLRCALWNIANLGGKFGYKYPRDPDVVKTIAEMLAHVGADFIAILEVLQHSTPPREPKKRPEPAERTSRAQVFPPEQVDDEKFLALFYQRAAQTIVWDNQLLTLEDPADEWSPKVTEGLRECAHALLQPAEEVRKNTKKGKGKGKGKGKEKEKEKSILAGLTDAREQLGNSLQLLQRLGYTHWLEDYSEGVAPDAEDGEEDAQSHDRDEYWAQKCLEAIKARLYFLYFRFLSLVLPEKKELTLDGCRLVKQKIRPQVNTSRGNKRKRADADAQKEDDKEDEGVAAEKQLTQEENEQAEAALEEEKARYKPELVELSELPPWAHSARERLLSFESETSLELFALRLARYRQQLALWAQTNNAGHPGIRDFIAIKDELNRLTNSAYDSWPKCAPEDGEKAPDIYTHGETYGVLWKRVRLQADRKICHASEGFSKRTPLIVPLKLDNRATVVFVPWHAPSPDKKRNARARATDFAAIVQLREALAQRGELAILLSDLNINTKATGDLIEACAGNLDRNNFFTNLTADPHYLQRTRFGATGTTLRDTKISPAVFAKLVRHLFAAKLSGERRRAGVHPLQVTGKHFTDLRDLALHIELLARESRHEEMFSAYDKILVLQDCDKMHRLMICEERVVELIRALARRTEDHLFIPETRRQKGRIPSCAYLLDERDLLDEVRKAAEDDLAEREENKKTKAKGKTTRSRKGKERVIAAEDEAEREEAEEADGEDEVAAEGKGKEKAGNEEAEDVPYHWLDDDDPDRILKLLQMARRISDHTLVIADMILSDLDGDGEATLPPQLIAPPQTGAPPPAAPTDRARSDWDELARRCRALDDALKGGEPADEPRRQLLDEWDRFGGYLQAHFNSDDLANEADRAALLEDVLHVLARAPAVTRAPSLRAAVAQVNHAAALARPFFELMRGQSLYLWPNRGDGDCLFHSLSQLGSAAASTIRRQLVAHLLGIVKQTIGDDRGGYGIANDLADFCRRLKQLLDSQRKYWPSEHPYRVLPGVDEWEWYANTMALPGTWGDLLMVCVASHRYGVQFEYYVDVGNDTYWRDQIDFSSVVGRPTWHLRQFAGLHFEAIRPTPLSDAGGPRPLSVVKYEGQWSRASAAADPTSLYVFGDNARRKEYSNQAVIRGLSNAYGVRTLYAPGGSHRFVDARLRENQQLIQEDVDYIKAALAGGGYDRLILPWDNVKGRYNLGTGIAGLPENSPLTFTALQKALAGLEGDLVMGGAVSVVMKQLPPVRLAAMGGAAAATEANTRASKRLRVEGEEDMPLPGAGDPEAKRKREADDTGAAGAPSHKRAHAAAATAPDDAGAAGPGHGRGVESAHHVGGAAHGEAEEGESSASGGRAPSTDDDGEAGGG